MLTLTALPLLVAPLAFASVQDTQGAALDFVQKPPQGCLAYVEWREPQRMLEAFDQHPVLGPLVQGVVGEVLGEGPELADLIDALAIGDEDFAATMERLAGDGLSMWVNFVEFEPAFSFALAADDEAEAQQRRQDLLRAFERMAGVPEGVIGAPTEVVDEVEIWDLEELFMIGKGPVTYLSNKRSALDTVVKGSRLVPGRRALRRLEAAHAARSGGAPVYAWVDIGAINSLMGLAGGAMGDEGPAAMLAQLQEMPRDPELQSLLGPGIANMVNAESLSLTMEVEDGRLALNLASDGVKDMGGLEPSSPAPAIGPGDTDMLHAVVHRDMATMLRERQTLFDAPKLANIAMTVAQLELFLGGLTLQDDVLPGVSPWMEVVAREIPFGSSPRPDLRLPAAAFVLDITSAPELGESLDAAFQGLVSVTNVGRAENGEPPLRLVLGRDEDLTWTAAHFPTPAADGPVDAFYNFAPAAAQVGDRWIVATHEELLVDLMRELPARATTTGAPRTVETLRIAGPALAAMIEPQLDALALMQALEDGVPREKARADLEGLTWILQRTDAEARIAYAEEAVTIGVELSFPEAAVTNAEEDR